MFLHIVCVYCITLLTGSHYIFQFTILHIVVYTGLAASALNIAQDLHFLYTVTVKVSWSILLYFILFYGFLLVYFPSLSVGNRASRVKCCLFTRHTLCYGCKKGKERKERSHNLNCWWIVLLSSTILPTALLCIIKAWSFETTAPEY